jgi:hypothetical protein
VRGREIAIGALLAFGTLFWTQALDTFEAAVWILLALALVTFGSAIFLAAGVGIDADGGELERGIDTASRELPPADRRRQVCRRILR